MIQSPSIDGVPRFADRAATAKCLLCRSPFTKNAPNQKCCSERCRLERNRQKLRAAEKRERARRVA